MKYRLCRALVAKAGSCLALIGPAEAAEWPVKIEPSGLVEVEANVGADYAGRNFSDIALATLELGLDAALSSRVTAHVLLLHEDGETEPIELDEGTVSLDYGALVFTGGRMYVPFGVYDTHMISDPLTLEIGETREAALQLTLEMAGLYRSVYAFNGSTIEAASAANDEDTVEGFGISVGFTQRSENLNFNLGMDYISNIGDSDTLGEWLDASVGSQVQSLVDGIVLHGDIRAGPWGLIAEYLQSDQFAVGELDYRGRGAELAALNLEGAYTFQWGGRETTLAGAYQMTDEALDISLPEARVLVGVGVLIENDTMLKLEYARDDDYSVEDGGTGQDASTLTAQLAVAF